MAALDDLLARIDDPALREALTQEIKPLRGEQELGLVFERHLPEKARLYGHPVRRGLTVELRAQQPSPTWTVLKVTDGTATVRRVGENQQIVTKDYPVEDLVVVREFGDPIYPGLESVGRVERGGDKPFHTVINAENYHALETLLFAYEGQVDCLYLDPPYNSGARDWRYNNDYVDSNDRNRHSKWLSFMEKRLQLAKRLLNPEKSVLIVTIDEKEYVRLGLLLEQVFPAAAIQMCSVVINPSGTSRGLLSRVDEYVYFVFIGEATPCRGADNLLTEVPDESGSLTWESLLRRGNAWYRESRPNLCYPVLISPSDGAIVGVGEPFSGEDEAARLTTVNGLDAAWPVRSDGRLGIWRKDGPGLKRLVEKGYAYASNPDSKRGTWSIKYLMQGTVDAIERGDVQVDRSGARGQVVANAGDVGRGSIAKTVWHRAAHNAGMHGSALLRALIPGHAFPFPKSLYAVEDALRIAVGDEREALVVDFFAGSGTTAHAVMRLNHQDGGQRRSIMVTNNEVGVDEQRALRAEGLLPGDDDWEVRGIFEYITKPRLVAAVTGCTPDGKPVKGEYKFTDPFPMADGFEENVEFFRLTYEDRDRVELGASFEAIAPLLWLRAGAQGPRVNQVDPKGWALPDGGRFGVLFVADVWRQFIEALADRDYVTHAFIVTDSDAVFQQVVAELPAGVEPVRLYGGYLTSFAINTGAQP